VLTINRAVQAQVEEMLKKNVEHNDALGGQVIVMNPQTGEIIAMANYPSFNPNEYWKVYETWDEGIHAGEFKNEVGVTAWDWTAPEADKALADKVAAGFTDSLTSAYQIADKLQRQEKVSELRSNAVEQLAAEEGQEGWDAQTVKDALETFINHKLIVFNDDHISVNMNVKDRSIKTLISDIYKIWNNNPLNKIDSVLGLLNLSVNLKY